MEGKGKIDYFLKKTWAKAAKKIKSGPEEDVREGRVLPAQASNELCTAVFLDPSFKEKLFD